MRSSFERKTVDERHSATDQSAPELEDVRFNRKQQILEARGKSVAVDLFLYSCLEHERLLAAKGSQNTNIIRWPLLGTIDSPETSSEITAKDIQNLQNLLITWYRDTFPALSIRAVIDREMLHEVVEPLVALNLDLSSLHAVKIGKSLPLFKKSSDPGYFWNDLAKVMQEYFPQHADLYLRYLRWSHAEEPAQEFEIGDVPPVGRNAPRMPKRDREDRGSRSAQRSNERPSASTRERIIKGKSTDRPTRSYKQDRSERGEKRHSRERDRTQRSSRREHTEVDPAVESAALADVKYALDKLTSDTGLNEVTLQPTNSFYRRLQHQTIVDAGFSSYSVGEGSARAVKVSRKS